MDSITQAALGAAIGKATLGKYIGNKSIVIGVVVATIPDLDVALYLIYNKFEMLSIHRGYSHSILVSLIGSVLLSLLFKRMKWTKEILPIKQLATGEQLTITAHTLKGAQKGPHVHIQASVHGAELQGNAVILKLMEALKTENLII